MRVPVSEAKAQLTDLVRRAEAGEEIVLTRRGEPVARIEALARKPRRDPAALMAFLEDIAGQASREALPGPSAARSQDFLYDEGGAPKTIDWNE